MAETTGFSAALQQTKPLAAAREQLDAAIASLLEAATAEVSGDALLRKVLAFHLLALRLALRKALAEGQEMERQRVMALLMDRLDRYPSWTDTRRLVLYDLLEDITG